MSDGIVPTEQDYEIARNGIEMQLKAAVIQKMKIDDEEYVRLRETLTMMGLDEFIDNEVSCAAHNTATIRMLYNVINKPLQTD